MKYIIFVLIIITMWASSKPVQAVAVGANELVSVLSINPLFNIATSVYAENPVIKFSPTGESAVSGEAQVHEAADGLGAQVSLKFSNLKPNYQYIAVYHRNAECSTEINSIDNVIQGAFIADEFGNGNVEDGVKDGVSKINSISLRSSKNFKNVFACARV